MLHAGSIRDWVCLMYHEIPQSPGGQSRNYFAVPSDRFAEQLAHLRACGLRGTSLETFLRAPAPDQVALTFDDGHETHYAFAFPILAGLGFSATFFITTSWVGTEPYVSWTQLREMTAAGMSIQSHTHTHPFLSTLDRNAVARELTESKRQLDTELGQETITLALPGGDAPRHAHAPCIRKAGYRIIATSAWGTNRGSLPRSDGLIVVRRYTVRRDTTSERFETLARGRSRPWSPEGLRLRALHHVRRLVGPHRYARWRRTILQSVRT